MKAIVKKEATEGLSWEDVPMPEMGDHEVLIKVEKTSICGTDVHLYLWDEWAAKTLPVPSIIGHEFSGKIVEVGKHVKGFNVGDRVSGEGHTTCGACLQCRTGRRVLCPNTINYGVDRDGAFAEYVAIPAENAFPIPDQISFETAALFDSLGNTVHTALSFDLVGKDVLITGAGPIGLMAIAVAKYAGARHVVISDLNEYRLRLAESFHPARVVDVKHVPVEEVMGSLGMEWGFDVCLEMSGSPAALASLPELTNHGGQIVLLGILPEQAHIDWHKVIFKMLTIKGIYGREIFNTWYQMVHMLQGGLDVSAVITHRYSAQDYQLGFDAMLSGESGKVILDWTNV